MGRLMWNVRLGVTNQGDCTGGFCCSLKLQGSSSEKVNEKEPMTFLKTVFLLETITKQVGQEGGVTAGCSYRLCCEIMFTSQSRQQTCKCMFLELLTGIWLPVQSLVLNNMVERWLYALLKLLFWNLMTYFDIRLKATCRRILSQYLFFYFYFFLIILCR